MYSLILQSGDMPKLCLNFNMPQPMIIEAMLIIKVICVERKCFTNDN